MDTKAPVNLLSPLEESSLLAVSAHGLVKRFGEVRAVDGIDLEIPRGMIFAILGPNGAGKTTLMRMLATLASPDEGSATVMGHDLLAAPHAVRAAIALTGQFASLDEDLTGRENLLLLARLWGFRGRKTKERADELLAAFDLSDAGHKQVKAYSGGMRRRLDIAASLVVTPGVLFLDEPTTGLDPKRAPERLAHDSGARGSRRHHSAHDAVLDEADQLAARIAVIDKGKKIAEGTSRELKAATGSGLPPVCALPILPNSLKPPRCWNRSLAGAFIAALKARNCRSWPPRRRSANQAIAVLDRRRDRACRFFYGLARASRRSSSR